MDQHIYSQKMIKNLKSHLNNISNRYINYPKFIFLCGRYFDKDNEGAFWESNRGVLQKYFEAQKCDLIVVLSEKLWEDAFSSDIDLLSFEEFLAEVSDYIILFPESPGSFCELGAFSFSDELFTDKLIVVNDTCYEKSKSFIATGPVAKVRADGATVLYADLNGKGLLSSESLRKELIKIVQESKISFLSKNKRIINTAQDKVNIYSFIIEILELLKILQPISKSDLIEIYKAVKNFDSFSFVNKNNKKINCSLQYIYKLLEFSKLIKLKNDEISLVDTNKIQDFMFNYFGLSRNKERSLFLCKKYRYGAKKDE